MVTLQKRIIKECLIYVNALILSFISINLQFCIFMRYLKKLINILNQNFIDIVDKQTISCAVILFWMKNSILLKLHHCPRRKKNYYAWDFT